MSLSDRIAALKGKSTEAPKDPPNLEHQEGKESHGMGNPIDETAEVPAGTTGEPAHPEAKIIPDHNPQVDGSRSPHDKSSPGGSRQGAAVEQATKAAKVAKEGDPDYAFSAEAKARTI